MEWGSVKCELYRHDVGCGASICVVDIWGI